MSVDWQIGRVSLVEERWKKWMGFFLFLNVSLTRFLDYLLVLKPTLIVSSTEINLRNPVHVFFL